MLPSLGAAPGFTRRPAPVTSAPLTRAVAASLVIAVASLGAILALTLLAAPIGAAPFAL